LGAPKRLGLDLRVPGWNRKSSHISQHPGVPVGDGAAEISNLGREHLFG
jgi:hypothetical protein